MGKKAKRAPGSTSSSSTSGSASASAAASGRGAASASAARSIPGAPGAVARLRRPSLREDPRRWIYIVACLVFTVGYLWAYGELLHNRFGWARAVLYVLPVCSLGMAVGTFVGGRWGWLGVVVAGAAMLLWTVGIIIVLLVTASFLSGVYGAFGKAASSMALLTIAFVIQFAATLPALQLKWAMTRAGRRAFGLTPLWRQQAAAS